MALSLPGERSIAAATPVNPVAAMARWIVKAQAARARRNSLRGLLDLDQARLSDLGISRDDIVKAMASPIAAGASLNAARSRNAHL